MAGCGGHSQLIRHPAPDPTGSAHLLWPICQGSLYPFPPGEAGDFRHAFDAPPEGRLQGKGGSLATGIDDVSGLESGGSQGFLLPAGVAVVSRFHHFKKLAEQFFAAPFFSTYF